MIIALLAFSMGIVTASPLGTAFTYQGRLTDGGQPASGSYDLKFTIYDAATSGSVVGGPLTNSATSVTNGLFTVALDFGRGIFTGDARWLELAVRTNGAAADFTMLSPRQAVTPAPYALYSSGAGTADSVSGPVAASQIVGTLAPANIAAGTISSAMLAPGSVTTAALADGAVSLGNLQITALVSLAGVITNPAPAIDDRFGQAVVMAGGDKILIAAALDDVGGLTNVGTVHLYDWSGTLLTTFTNPAPSNNDYFGNAMAAVGTDRVLIAANGDNTGATAAGAAYLFNLNGALLMTFTNPTPATADYFGNAVAAIGADKVAIGAYLDDTGALNAGTVYLFSTNGTLLTTITNPTPASGDYFGYAVAGVGADKVLIGAYQDGASAYQAGIAYLFNTTGALLTTFTNPTPAMFDRFGSAVAAAGADKVLIAADGKDIGAVDAGAAYLFDLSGRLLTTFTNPTPASYDNFGCSLAALGADEILIGASGDYAGAPNAGVAHLFSSGGRLLTTITNPVPWSNERFGCAVAAVASDRLVIGAYGEVAGTNNVGAVFLYAASTHLSGLAGDGATPGSITTTMLASGSVTTAQLAPASVTSAQLSPGAAFTNLYAGGQSGVAGGGIVLSEDPNNANLINAGYVKIGKADLISEHWATNLTAGPPTSGRLNLGCSDHSAVWTGTEMIIWGGYNEGNLNEGARYNPVANSWTLLSKSNAPSARTGHTAVWTGTQMLIWGGEGGNAPLTTGGRYSPATGLWSPMSTNNAPAGCVNAVAVWASTNLLVWGGEGESYYWDITSTNHYMSATYGTGARYNPTANTWTALSTNNAPSPRCDAAGIWTGTELIVWGGRYDEYVWASVGYYGWGWYLDTASRLWANGGRYNPATGLWTALSTTNAPEACYGAAAVWSGSQMLVWGGATITNDGYSEYSVAINTGARYNPTANTWSSISTVGAPAARLRPTVLWAGNRMVVWGGHVPDYYYNAGLQDDGNVTNTGARYDPTGNTWTATTTTAAPQARWKHTAVWTGSQMIVWGGDDRGYPVNYLEPGGRYDVTNNTWTSMAVSPGTGEPGARANATAVWTGSEMIIWGGEADGYYLRSGARYNSAADAWTTLPLAGAPSARSEHRAVWSGSEMLVWGGYNGDPCGDGARYNPTLNTWRTITNTAAPTPRSGHTAVWAGNEMIVWGGAGNTWLNDGGRYDPVSNVWRTITTNGAPWPRAAHTAVWTGNEMVVWGGLIIAGPAIFIAWDDGGRYNPATDQWSATTTNGAPAARWDHTAVWTGHEMIVWGGQNTYSNLFTGARYLPGSPDSWMALSTNSYTYPRSGYTAVWDGGHMLIWGGWSGSDYLYTGSLYDPALDAWSGIAYTAGPAKRANHTAVWAGTEMLISGGYNGTVYLNSLGAYTPPRTTYLYLKP